MPKGGCKALHRLQSSVILLKRVSEGRLVITQEELYRQIIVDLYNHI